MSEIASPSAQLYDISGPQPQLGELPHDEVHDAILSGQFSFPKGVKVPVFSPEGELGELPAEEAHAAFNEGYRYATPTEVRSEKYGTAGQQVKTALEGIAEGIAGPLAPLAETKLGIAKKEDILNRKEENPILHGASQAIALVGGAFTGTGEAAVLSKAGTLAKELAGFGEAAKGMSLGFKVGSSAVSNAAEMAVLQGSDEVSKMILQDPSRSAESAIANVGLSAALGGLGGAAFTGVINPLWEATAGPKLESLLSGVRDHMNGNTMVLPEELKLAKDSLGVNIPRELEAVISSNPTAISHYNILKEAQNKPILESLEKFHKDMSESVAQSLGILPEDVAVYSENEAGHDILSSFKKEFQQKYGPIAEAFEKRNAEAAKIAVTDDARLNMYGKILENGMEKVGTDSPMYKLYNEYGNRLLAKETVGAIDSLKTEINGEIDKAVRASDTNALMALKDIRSSIADFQEQQILNQASQLEKSGVEGAGKLGKDLLNERAETNRMYKDFATMSNELTDHLGIGRFTGAQGLTNKLTEKISAEQLANKFSFKGNADFIPFLQKNFPEVYEKVRENELKRFLKPAVLSAKEDMPLNISKLNGLLEKGMSGQKEYIESILPKEAIDRIAAANKLSAAIPNMKSSGTAGWMTKMFKDVPRNAMAAVSMITGHNPIIGAVLGETAQLLSRDAPDAVRLAHLKFLASNQPIKSQAFKSMVDFFHNTYKGENIISKATANVFKRGAQVLSTNLIPDDKDREKLDKLVTKMQDNPEALVQAAQKSQVGHYLPNHQQSITETTTRALQYCQSVKPQPHILGPLDKPVPPQPAEVARYNRCLDIAQQPAIVLHHVKEGTILPSDIADLHTMYPSLYKSMSQKLSNQMIKAHSDEETIPYRTRVGVSLFLGQPIDASMTPAAIMSAQPKPPQAPQQQGGSGKPHKGTSSLGKNVKSYQTPEQASEFHRSNRD